MTEDFYAEFDLSTDDGHFNAMNKWRDEFHNRWKKDLEGKDLENVEETVISWRKVEKSMPPKPVRVRPGWTKPKSWTPTNIDELLGHGWELAGHVDVDAGLVMVGDPCYATVDGHPKDDWHPIHDWRKFCNDLGEFQPTIKSLNHKLGHEGAGVVVSSGYGDGTYPVLVRRAETNWGERVVEMRVLFMYSGDEE